MAETSPDNRIECRTCRGSGTLDDEPCSACKGRGWLESDDAKEADITFDFGEWGGGLSWGDKSDAGSVTEKPGVLDTDGDVLGSLGDSDSMLDGAVSVTESLGSPKVEDRSRGTDDPESTPKELSGPQERIKQVIPVAESPAAGGQAKPTQPKAERKGSARGKCPATIDDVLEVLEKSQLLAPEQLRDARLLATDAKIFAKRLVEAKLLTEWQMEQLLGGRTSFLLDKYKLLQVIRATSAGVVLLAEHMDQRFAVRVLSRKLSQNKTVSDRLLSQARNLAGLNHPNIIRTYDADESNGRYHVVMEYIDGRDLQEIVGAEGPFPFEIAADVVAQAAKALHHGHVNGFVHGDVCPSNLFLDREQAIKIDYLSLARIQEEGSDASVSNSSIDRMVHTIDYLAPECGQLDAIEPPADVYSLGCTLYFLLTGQPPFPEGSPSEKWEKHQKAEPEDIRALRADTPEPLVKLCSKMMAKDPKDRYPICEAAAEALLLVAGRKNDSG